MTAHWCLQRIRLWWAERAVDGLFSTEASFGLDAALVAWESAR